MVASFCRATPKTDDPLRTRAISLGEFDDWDGWGNEKAAPRDGRSRFGFLSEYFLVALAAAVVKPDSAGFHGWELRLTGDLG